MLVAQHQGKRIEAAEAAKGLDYCCPGCGGAVMLKQGRQVIHHFAHWPNANCAFATGETLAHLAAKQLIADEFARRGLRVEIEHVVDVMPGDRRADVMVWIEGQPIAFEVQHSPLDLGLLEARAGAYARVGVAQCWIPFRRWTLPHNPFRPFERWVYGFFRGCATWMYDPEDSTFWRWKIMGSHGLYIEGYQDYRGPFSLDRLEVKTLIRESSSVPGYFWPRAQLAYLTPKEKATRK